MTDGNITWPPLNLPRVQLKLSREGSIIKVYDQLRDKYVALTPEEYVRQHFTAWLLCEKHYPKSLLANEIGIEVNCTKRRCDTVAFSPEGKPLMIVEYKAPGVNVTQAVFDQIVRYNMSLRALYLAVSNGLRHYCCRIDYDNGSYHFIPEIPDYLSLMSKHSEN